MRRSPSEFPTDMQEAIVANSAYTSALDWDYCKTSSCEDMENHIQVAGILVMMAEVGSLWNQLQQLSETHQDYQTMQTELQYAVQNSYTLMCEQGYAGMAGCWAAYLQETGEIQEEWITINPHLSPAMISNLAQRVEESMTPTPQDQKIELGLKFAANNMGRVAGIERDIASMVDYIRQHIASEGGL